MAYFSIIIPVYNKVGTMDACVASIREQTFEDFEVLLVNDGSTDGSLSMLHAFAQQDARFRVLSLERNQSVLAARLAGVKAAAEAGSHVLFIDSDDQIEPTMLQEIHDTFEETGAELIRFGLRVEREDAAWDWLPEPCEDLLAALFDGMPPAVWKNAYAPALIDRAAAHLESFYCNMAEDAYLSTVFFALADSEVALRRPLYRYAVGNGMSTTVLSQEKMRRVLDYLSAAGTHILTFVERYCSAYLEQAERFVEAMYRHQLVQNLAKETDWTQIVRILALFDREECQNVFRFGCTELLSTKMKYDGEELPPEEWQRLEG